MMGGDVTVESKFGEGSTFTFVFRTQPAISAPQLSNQTQDVELPSHMPSGLHVLLADDNTINRKIARMMLTPHGAVIAEAVNGQEALDILEHQHFDIVLLDVHMPVMDGMETIARIRASAAPWRDVAVIALTADAMGGDKDRLLAAGMDGYISKPIDLNALTGEIHRVLHLARETPGRTIAAA